MNISVNFSNQILASKEKKALNKPFRTPKGPKKFSVYVKNDKGNIVKVNFGDPNMEIKRDQPSHRKSYRARHHCDTSPGPRWKANYWSCKMWESKKTVTDYTSRASMDEVIHQWDGETIWEQKDLLTLLPSLANVVEITEPDEELNEAPDNETQEGEDPEDEETESLEAKSAEMAIAQLKYVSETTTDLVNKLAMDVELQKAIAEPWILSKVSLMEDYVFSVYNYLVYQNEVSFAESKTFKVGDAVANINPTCKHHGSKGLVTEIKNLPDDMGMIACYKVENEGPNYKKGDILTKTLNQLKPILKK